MAERIEAGFGELAELYADVFAGPPWNEYTQCACNKYFGRETRAGDICPDGECQNRSILVPAYPRIETGEKIKKECARPDAVTFVIKKGQDIVGFSWGFSYQSPEEFAIEKYRTDGVRNKMVNLLTQYGVSSKFFYFSECGVKETERGNGYSNLLAKLLVDQARNNNLPLVMRTNWQSPMVAVARKFDMQQVMGPEVYIDNLSKTITQTSNIVNGIRDSEIGDRVLFVIQ